MEVEKNKDYIYWGGTIEKALRFMSFLMMKLSQEINILEIDNETVLSWKGVLHSYNFFFLHDFCLQSLSLSVDYSSGSC